MKLFPVAAAILLAAAVLLIAFRTGSEMIPASAEPVHLKEANERGEADSLKEIRRDVLLPARNAPVAPEFAAGEWVNSEPLKLESLRGRVVIVDFWTFGCYNCRNTLPSLKRWDATYRERGLTIIGIHSPEFEREKKIENVRRETSSLGIRYPVVTDNDYETWNAYSVRAWPTISSWTKEAVYASYT